MRMLMQRLVLRIGLASLVLGLWGLVAARAQGAAVPESVPHPNILIIVADDHAASG